MSMLGADPLLGCDQFPTDAVSGAVSAFNSAMAECPWAFPVCGDSWQGREAVGQPLEIGNGVSAGTVPTKINREQELRGHPVGHHSHLHRGWGPVCPWPRR